MFMILVAILIFGILIGIHEFGHFAAAKSLGVQVNEFAIGMGPALWQKQGKETLYSLRAFPIGGYCAMEGEDEESPSPRSFSGAKSWRKFVILAAGSFMNLVLGFLIILVLFSTATGFYMPTIDGFMEGYDTEHRGIESGDVVFAVDGHPIYNYSNLGTLLGRAGDTVSLEVERDGQRLKLDQVYLPRQEKVDEEGNLTNYRGITIGQKVFEATAANTIRFSWYNTLDFARMVYMNLLDLISGSLSITEMSGAVGIVDSISQVEQQAEDAAEATFNVSFFAALITINLGIMNLLPLPALDGGRIFFLLVNEVVFFLAKRKIPVKYEGYFHAAGIVMLLTLMAVVTYADIARIMAR